MLKRPTGPPYLVENQRRPRERKHRDPIDVEPTGPLHYRSTAQRTDGAACGALRVRLTSRREMVECTVCIDLL